MNADLDKCAPTVETRQACYAALDKKLTTKIVPWIPYLWSYSQSVVSKNVTKWDFDQFGGTIAYAHVAGWRPELPCQAPWLGPERQRRFRPARRCCSTSSAA